MIEDRACPCLYLDEPCHPRCTCRIGGSSLGCMYCCTYGSLEQRKEKAKIISSNLRRSHKEGLFQKKDLTLSSGRQSDFKIECDALTDEDWECLAYLISKKIKFSTVIGVPSGGKKLEQKLIKYQTVDKSDKQVTLIVDDVLTTGNSMNEIKKLIKTKDIKGVVVFARGKCPEWVQPLFSFSPRSEQ